MGIGTRLTLDEFLAIPDFDERRLELIDGEVYEKVSPLWGHGYIAVQLATRLNEHGFAAVEPRAMIPARGDIASNSPLPDVAFYRDQPPAADEWMTRPPDVAVEILSPGQGRRRMRAKIDAYLAFGVASVWIVDFDRRTIEVREGRERRTLGDAEVLEAPAVPGLAIDIAELFGTLDYRPTARD